MSLKNVLVRSGLGISVLAGALLLARPVVSTSLAGALDRPDQASRSAKAVSPNIFHHWPSTAVGAIDPQIFHHWPSAAVAAVDPSIFHHWSGLTTVAGLDPSIFHHWA